MAAGLTALPGTGRISRAILLFLFELFERFIRVTSNLVRCDGRRRPRRITAATFQDEQYEAQRAENGTPPSFLHRPDHDRASLSSGRKIAAIPRSVAGHIIRSTTSECHSSRFVDSLSSTEYAPAYTILSVSREGSNVAA